MQPQELAPTIDFLRAHLGLKPAHLPHLTHPHEPDPAAGSAEVL